MLSSGLIKEKYCFSNLEELFLEFEYMKIYNDNFIDLLEQLMEQAGFEKERLNEIYGYVDVKENNILYERFYEFFVNKFNSDSYPEKRYDSEEESTTDLESRKEYELKKKMNPRKIQEKVNRAKNNAVRWFESFCEVNYVENKGKENLKIFCDEFDIELKKSIFEI